MKNILPKNKCGKGNAGIVWAVIIVGVLITSALIFGLSQSQARGGTDDPNTCADSTTTLSFPTKNFYTQSSSVSVTPYGKVNDGAVTNLSTLSNFGIGANVTDVFYSASNYIDEEYDDFVVECGMTQAPTQKIKPTDAPSTFLIKDDSGTTLTDSASGGANNASNTAGTLELTLKVGASKDTTTGKLAIVVEYDNNTQASSISLTGSEDYNLEDKSFPKQYNDEASGSLTEAFVIPASEDGATNSYTLKIEPESGETLGAVGSAIRVTYYSLQAFEDTDGAVKVGIENIDGTTKAEDTGDYDVYVI